MARAHAHHHATTHPYHCIHHAFPHPVQITDLLTRQFLYVDERQWDRLSTEVFAPEVRLQ